MGQYVLRLGLAVVAGLVVGLINSRSDQNKSIKAFALICLGSALIAEIGLGIYAWSGIPMISDPLRLPAQIISALGFLGTGLLLFGDKGSEAGISTAAALWLTAIIGLLTGIGQYRVTLIGLVFILLVFWLSPILHVKTRQLHRYLVSFRHKD